MIVYEENPTESQKATRTYSELNKVTRLIYKKQLYF